VDAGVTGLRAAALRSRDIAGDVRFWTEGLGAEIADWVGDITYIRLEGEHHQIALYPSDRAGILYHSYGVADFDSVMRGYYALAEHQAEIIQGPGCETASGDIFLRARAAGGAIFSLVAPDTTAVSRHSPRQFERTATSLCSWGSRCEALPELSAAVAG
jgi:2,3-dihydroxy-p-cumate/2,3-dihydroxybenzoate 3,4-dioxygenase